ncbi:MAG: hypothetical protein ACRESJ_17400 [Pseudomonas sp.]|uniref:hypothetical protein n=1 Tax=Pseudomonas sp. TaxID=306 RepID=UPI003D7023A1
MYKLNMGMTESGKPYVAGIGVGVGQNLVTADRFAIKDSAQVAEGEKADLIKRRLSRLEEALGLNAICEH